MVRKKLRGMLALLLSLSMAMGLLGGTALAAEGEEGGVSPEAVEPAPEPLSQAVKWASENDIVSGFEDGKFRPGDPVKREQMAAILFNYARFKDYDVSGHENADFSGFKDISEMSAYAFHAMRWCTGNGVISGKGGGILDPRGKATRGQTAKMLYHFCENIAG